MKKTLLAQKKCVTLCHNGTLEMGTVFLRLDGPDGLDGQNAEEKGRGEITGLLSRYAAWFWRKRLSSKSRPSGLFLTT